MMKWLQIKIRTPPKLRNMHPLISEMPRKIRVLFEESSNT